MLIFNQKHNICTLGVQNIGFFCKKNLNCLTDNVEIFLCFGNPKSVENNKCYRATGPLEKFSQLPKSDHTHNFKTSIAVTSSKSDYVIFDQKL